MSQVTGQGFTEYLLFTRDEGAVPKDLRRKFL